MLFLRHLREQCMIQQKLEPEYNPRRLLRLVMMDMREEAFQSPTTWLCSPATCATRPARSRSTFRP